MVSKVKKETEELPPQKVFALKEFTVPSKPEPFYNNYQYDVPIAIDFGSSMVRAGLTNSEVPNNVFPTLVSRYRDRKSLKTLSLVGNDVYRDVILRTSTKSPYDGSFVTNWDYMEHIFDYTFEHLGVTSDNGRLNNPVILSEPPACPLSHRKGMYELLFEAYQAPKVTLGIDSLFSFYANNGPSASGLVIGTGHESTHIIPVLQGKGILSQTKRIDWGGSQSSQFISKLLSLKYPYFPTRLNSHHTTNLLKDHCYISTDYQEEISHFLDMDKLEEKDVVLQAPVDLSVVNDKKKSEEELARQAERKREQGRRLQEQAQQKRQEKLQQKQDEYDYYTNVKEEFTKLDESQIQARLESYGFDDVSDFNKYVTSLEKTLKKANNDSNETEEDVDPEKAWPLVDIPDEDLTEEQIKEKRKQRLHKGNYEARERNKELKKQEEELKAKQEREEKEWRERDLEGWCFAKRLELAELINKVKERARLLESFKDRKSVAAQKRMKNIADLANDQSASSAASRKRRRNANASIDNDPTDTFGANDDDWSIYRDITNVSVEEEQERDNASIVKLEEALLEFDPNFDYEDTLEASSRFDWQNSVLHKFLHGPRQNMTLSMQAEGHDHDEIANHPEIIKKNHQIHFNVERIRVPEVLFQPSMAGLDQAGVSEISEDLLYRRLDGNFTPGGQSYSLLNNVFLTGGLANFSNFETRLLNEFTSFLPVGTPLKIAKAKDVVVDAWRGMQKWSSTNECANSYVSKAEYEEYGAEYIKEHSLGNVCLL